MRIAFVGGGTLGPVTPLLAVARRIEIAGTSRNDKVEFIWFGTPDGPEKSVVEKEGFRFIPITVAKLPRHLDIRLLTFPFDSMKAQREAREALKSIKPDVVVTAGGFTGVPVVKEAAKLGIPCVMHQLDLVPGLSNRAVAKLCKSITTSFPYEKPPFGVPSTRIATPMRFSSIELPMREEACGYFGFDAERPVALIVGGGNGATTLNVAIDQQLDAWLGFAQVLQVTGKGKIGERKNRPGYVVREFLNVDDMKHAYAATDLVVTRAGIGALSEISGLSKAAIIVPIPDNQQETNAKAFHRAKAGLYVKQDQEGFSDVLVKLAKHVLSDKGELERMGKAAHEFFPTDDGTELAERVIKIASS
jgi:UDP-N-acetylglucosamine--N-acetylmuramyl-(pentapeptide) pyrophosphoryl-undecaprenol N-acetylglucosamine transferase